MDLIKDNETFEAIFQEHKLVLGKDFEHYRGHCYRILNYMNYWKLNEVEFKTCEVAIPFHDMGIWTHKTMDYLEVSFEGAKKYIEEKKLDIEKDSLENIIVNHHKISKIKDNSLAEKLRKADLIDLSFGVIKFGIDQKAMHSIVSEFPFLEFQQVIFKKVFSHAVRNILNPFPMLKF